MELEQKYLNFIVKSKDVAYLCIKVVFFALYYYYTVICLNRQLSVVHTVELNCYRAFVRKRILNYFRKKTSTALESEGAPNHPLYPPPPPNTHCGSQYVAAEPGRARRQRCYYIMKHAAQAQGRGGGGSERDDKKSSCVG